MRSIAIIAEKVRDTVHGSKREIPKVVQQNGHCVDINYYAVLALGGVKVNRLKHSTISQKRHFHMSYSAH
jgi:hypothetical protein